MDRMDRKAKDDVRESHTDYERLLVQFGAATKPAPESVRHLQALGYSKSQARNAVYRFRHRRGLAASSR